MTSDVSRLRVVEKVCIHGEALHVLQSGLGHDGCAEVIERAVVAVAEHLGTIEQALHLGDTTGLQKSARALASIGEQLGFLALARVSGDAINCADRQDRTALHAVIGRLMRVGDASLAEVIEAAALPG
jgi:hypothetical protein